MSSRADETRKAGRREWIGLAVIALPCLLPDGSGAALLDTAREAFTQGLQVTAVTGAVVLAALSVLVAVVLRRVRAGSEPGVQPV